MGLTKLVSTVICWQAVSLREVRVSEQWSIEASAAAATLYYNMGAGPVTKLPHNVGDPDYPHGYFGLHKSPPNRFAIGSSGVAWLACEPCDWLRLTHGPRYVRHV